MDKTQIDLSIRSGIAFHPVRPAFHPSTRNRYGGLGLAALNAFVIRDIYTVQQLQTRHAGAVQHL